ncbi:hypothetical protein NP493_599g02055 [Ridgeia piscesae]|uniref:DUF885 domain-containing protein n=1 Tax=Ridgeia piscesae TaxID=27915 RepID=A0AAD9NPB4_RIDPI|nr:hypothetical protein NP493_599g02055 [Ridgeia piscesae]
MYLPATRRHVGVWSLPNGTEYYRACLRWHLTVNTSPQHIHQLGLREVDRIEGTTRKLIASAQPDGNITAFMMRLRADPNNYYTSKVRLAALCELPYIKATPGADESISVHFFIGCRVDVSAHGAAGFYSEPAADGSRPGLYLLSVARLDTKPKFIFDALTLHEAEPGHHIQTVAAMHDTIPYFRKLIAYWHYTYVPFNWRYYTSCSEGWALYAEALGEEMGAYTSPHSLFGRYSYELFRATRLVVDTGLHAFKWSRQRAVAYMRAHTTLARESIDREVDRYIATPGQACSYKIGEMKIWELRRKTEKALGEAFDLRDFHHVLLHLGFAPLSVMEEEIDNYIRALKAKATSGKHDLTLVVLLVTVACVVASA